MSPGEVAAAVRSTLFIHVALSFDVHILACWDVVGSCVGHVYAVGYSGAGPVPGCSVDSPADWDGLKSLHARVRAHATTCHGGRWERTFCTAFVRADLRSTFELRDDLGCFGHPRHIF